MTSRMVKIRSKPKSIRPNYLLVSYVTKKLASYIACWTVYLNQLSISCRSLKSAPSKSLQFFQGKV